MNYEKIIRETVKNKAKKDNQIDLHAYENGIRDFVEQLKLYSVSQQRELLIAYEIEASKHYNASEEMVKPKVDRIMKAINCG